MLTIQREFDYLIENIYPTKDGKPGNRCSLTYKKRVAFERIYFTAFRTAMLRVMMSTEKPEDEASEIMDETFAELTAYFEEADKEPVKSDDP